MAELPIGQETYYLLNTPQVRWRTAAFVVLATGLVALCSRISIPLGFTPVPLTMQPFAVMLLGLLFGPAAAFSCLALYLAEGAIGLPVFTPHGLGGIAQLLGPSGGYLLSYPFAAALASRVYRSRPRSFAHALAGATAASLLILTTGAAWLELLTHMKLGSLFYQSVAPFLLGDAIKVAAAAGCATLLHSVRRGRQDAAL